MNLFTSQRAILAAALAVALNLTACATPGTPGSTPVNLAASIGAEADLGTFNKLVKQAGLSDTLNAAGPVTVFAPNDAAFKAVPAATLDQLSKDPELLKSVLNFHIVPGSIKSADIDSNKTLSTLQGGKLNVSKAGDFITVEEGMVVKPDLQATNGIVHVIDTVLIPPKKK